MNINKSIKPTIEECKHKKNIEEELLNNLQNNKRNEKKKKKNRIILKTSHDFLIFMNFLNMNVKYLMFLPIKKKKINRRKYKRI